MTALQIEHLAPDALSPNPWNSNSVGPEMEKRLEASLDRLGFFKPIIVREIGPELQILGGEHRWRLAMKRGMATVPVMNLGRMTDKKAKEIGLADNGGYGEDDALKLSSILREIGVDDAEMFLPYTEKDLAGIFAADEIDLDALGLDDRDDSADTLPEAVAKTTAATHVLMHFKVPIEDKGTVEKHIASVIKRQGLVTGKDSVLAAGLALVAMVQTAEAAE